MTARPSAPMAIEVASYRTALLASAVAIVVMAFCVLHAAFPHLTTLRRCSASMYETCGNPSVAMVIEADAQKPGEAIVVMVFPVLHAALPHLATLSALFVPRML